MLGYSRLRRIDRSRLPGPVFWILLAICNGLVLGLGGFLFLLLAHGSGNLTGMGALATTSMLSGIVSFFFFIWSLVNVSFAMRAAVVYREKGRAPEN